MESLSIVREALPFSLGVAFAAVVMVVKVGFMLALAVVVDAVMKLVAVDAFVVAFAVAVVEVSTVVLAVALSVM